MSEDLIIGHKINFLTKIREDIHTIRLGITEGKSSKWNRRRKAKRMARLMGEAICFKREVEADDSWRDCYGYVMGASR